MTRVRIGREALYFAWPETALLAKCEDRACQGAVAEKSAILTGVEYDETFAVLENGVGGSW